MLTPQPLSLQADLIVVGGGLAGLSAAALVGERAGRSSSSNKRATSVAGRRPGFVKEFIGIWGRMGLIATAMRSGFLWTWEFPSQVVFQIQDEVSWSAARRPRFDPDPAQAERLTDAFLQACSTGDLNGFGADPRIRRGPLQRRRRQGGRRAGSDSGCRSYRPVLRRHPEKNARGPGGPPSPRQRPAGFHDLPRWTNSPCDDDRRHRRPHRSLLHRQQPGQAQVRGNRLKKEI